MSSPMRSVKSSESDEDFGFAARINVGGSPGPPSSKSDGRDAAPSVLSYMVSPGAQMDVNMPRMLNVDLRENLTPTDDDEGGGDIHRAAARRRLYPRPIPVTTSHVPGEHLRTIRSQMFSLDSFAHSNIQPGDPAISAEEIASRQGQQEFAFNMPTLNQVTPSSEDVLPRPFVGDHFDVTASNGQQQGGNRFSLSLEPVYGAGL